MANKKTKSSSTVFFLNPQIIDKFRKKINETPIFYSDQEHKPRWSFICAMMDRIQSCVKYLNENNKNKFEAEEEFINFLIYCCIIKDAVIELFKQTNINYPYTKSRKFLNKIYIDFINLYSKDRPQYTPPTNPPSDDAFFAFLRSLAFAHPLETNRAKFIQKGETLYSPFVLVNGFLQFDIVNPVGLNIYSNNIEDIMHLWFSLDTIKAYIRSRYNLLIEAIKWIDITPKDLEEKWRKRKVNRSLSPVNTLKDIRDILTKRYAETFSIDEAIMMLECPVSTTENETAVETYKNNIIHHIPELCDWIDGLQQEEDYPAFFKEVSGYPKKLHSRANYQITKILNYLDNDVIDYAQYAESRASYISKAKAKEEDKMCNYNWGLWQAEHFFKDIGISNIKFDIAKIKTAKEIKLLVNTALFFARKKQV